MSITNNQLKNDTISLLKSLIGLKMDQMLHEEFIFSSASFGYVYFKINGKIYALSDFYEIKDVLGYEEEISTLKFYEYNDEIKSHLVNGKICPQSINSTINKITLVNTRTTITKNGDIKELLDTHAIIFTLDDDYEYSFEKDDYGENISIERGYNLSNKFKSLKDELLDSFESELNPQVELYFTTI
jgi:hypothetical protein